MTIQLYLLTRNSRSSGRQGYGFSLPELLVATIIAALIAAITAQVMISQLLEERRLETAQRIREDVSRLNYLVQIEASEAQELDLATVAISGCPAGDANAFTFVVPRPAGTYATSGNESRIRYYNAVDPDDSDRPAIWRCGPPVTRNGVLIHGGANVVGVVMRNSQLDRATCPALNARNVSYRVVPPAGLAGANLPVTGLGDCVTAHARSVFVCNPAIDTSVPCNERVGDCDCL